MRRGRSSHKGFGFVIPDRTFREGDLFIPLRSVNGALSRDRVRARVTQRSSRRGRENRDRLSGEIVDVIERGQDKFVGTLVQRGGQWLVEPDGFPGPVALVLGPHREESLEHALRLIARYTRAPHDDYRVRWVQDGREEHRPLDQTHELVQIRPT